MVIRHVACGPDLAPEDLNVACKLLAVSFSFSSVPVLLQLQASLITSIPLIKAQFRVSATKGARESGFPVFF